MDPFLTTDLYPFLTTNLYPFLTTNLYPFLDSCTNLLPEMPPPRVDHTPADPTKKPPQISDKHAQNCAYE